MKSLGKEEERKRMGECDGHLQILNLSSFKLEEWKDEEPTTFFSIDFFAHETQVTNPVTGLEVSLGWSREFELEVDDVFLEYVERESIILDLMRRTSGEVPFSRMASADVRLAPLMEDAGILNHRLELFGIDGKKLGYVVVNIRMKDSIAPLVASYRRIKDSTSEAASMEAAAFFRHNSVPLDQIVLNVVVLRCQGLRSSRYGVLPWPYVQYELPGSGEDPHTTKTVEKEGNPVYEDRRSWRLKSPATAFALRDLELEVFVFDDNETDDLQVRRTLTILPLPLLLPALRVPLPPSAAGYHFLRSAARLWHFIYLVLNLLPHSPCRRS